MRVAVRVLALLLLAGAAPAATLTVTIFSETGPGSFGQAILDSNASVGVLDTIEFNVPGTPPFAILLFNGLPTITDPVVIDGTTQPGYVDKPVLQIRQGLLNGNGLTLAAGGSTIRGLSFADLSVGLRIEGDGNTIEACFFGTDVTGMLDVGNGIGINLVSADNTLIGGTTSAARNLISGNNGFGIQMSGSGFTVVSGNFIGTTVDGTAPLPNQVGIYDSEGHNDTIGGTTPGAGNVISANTRGVDLSLTFETLVAGNFFGTDVTGTLPIGNGDALRSQNGSTGLLVGGTSAAARNVFGDNDAAILLLGFGDDAEILGNFIGVDVGGSLPLGNGYGIMINDANATDTRIGGVSPGEANVIAFNQTGIWNLGTRTGIRGNAIHDNEELGIDHQNVGPSPNDGGENDAVQNFPIVDSTVITAAELVAGGSVRVQGSLLSDPGDYTLDFYANPPCAENPQEFLEGETWIGSAPLTIAAGETAFDVTFSVSVAPGARISATATDSVSRTSEFSQRLPWSIAPSTGPGSGGTAVQVAGTDLDNGLTATIGGVAMTNIVAFGPFFNGNTPALPGGVWDLTVTTPSGRTSTLPRAWTVDFADVPPSDPFYSYIEILVRHAITAGVGGGSYGSTQPTLRQQMAVFLLKAIHGICYLPPPCTGVFQDVPCASPFAGWIEAFAAAGITTGCGTDVYCPANPVRRDQMAVFLLKAKYGPNHDPPDCQGVFDDVDCASPFADWIEQLAAEGITGGCGGDNYCPLNPTTRGQMAVFIVRTFELE
jgi:hypothetical protein